MAEPTRRAALLALAARVEQAAEGSRKLDEAISCAVFPELRQVWVTDSVTGPEMIWQMHGERVRILDYSHSVDAAMSLVPKGLSATVSWMKRGSAALFHYSGSEIDWCRDSTASTPALALTAAALRARAAME